jgi:dTMP kinase
MRRKGFFVSIEGGEKAGKTTQAALLADWLRQQGFDTLVTREPGGTAAGEAIRSILLHSEDHGLTAVSEALLFAASRGQLVAEVIGPALEAGKVVVADRYVDSSLAYQGIALSLPFEKVMAVNEWATGGLWPDLTVLLDCPDPATVAGRPRKGEADRIEKRQEDFHRRVAEGFRQLALRDPQRYVVVDASLPTDEVAEIIGSAVYGRITGKEVPGR